MDPRDSATATGPGGATPEAFEDDVFRRLQRSDVDALKELYRRQSPGIYALCLRMLRDPQRAEEAMQDTFWQVWSKPEQFDPQRGKLSTFLFQVARSRCLDRIRAEKSQSDRIQSACLELETSAEDQRGPTPLQTAIESQDRARVRRALDDLSSDYREVVILSYFEGLSHSEIADRLEMPVGTVKTRVRRGLLALRKNLKAAVQR